MKGIVDIRITRKDGGVEDIRLYNQIGVGVFNSLRDKSKPENTSTYNSTYVPKRVKIVFDNGAEYTTANLTSSTGLTMPDKKIIFKTGDILGSAFDPDTSGSTVSTVGLLAATGDDNVVAVADDGQAGDWSSTSSIASAVGNDDTINVTYTLSFNSISGTNGGAWDNESYVNNVRNVVAGVNNPDTSGEYDITVETFAVLDGSGDEFETLGSGSATASVVNDTIAGQTVSASWKADFSMGSLSQQPQHLEIRDVYGNTIDRYDITTTWSSATFEAGDGIEMEDYEFGFGQTVT